MTEIYCGFWNMLANGLAHGEFMTNGGDNLNVDWLVRKSKIVNCLSMMLEQCGFVVVVENDHYYYLLNELNKVFDQKISGMWYAETKLDETNKPVKISSMARKMKKVNMDNTFLTECGIDFAEDFAQIYNASIDDPYTSDDGIAIYYRNDVFEFESESENYRPRNINKRNDIHIYGGSDQFIRVNLRHIGSQKNIIVYGVHLSSGEGIDKELSRSKKMDLILKSASSDRNMNIILADLNTSKHYGMNNSYDKNKDKIETVFDVINKYNFKNVINDKFNECYKMRHAHGGQPLKFGQLMFDTIDAILVKNNVDCIPINTNYGFTKYPSYMRDAIVDLRMNPEKRAVLFKYSVNANNYHAKSNYIGIKLVDQSTSESESDIVYIDGNPINRWGENMNHNQTTGLSKILNFNNSSSNNTPDEQIKEMFLSLYPNKNAPSDHPIIACRLIID